ncbi:aspartyl protease family protein 2-like [Papaver somniferum]|uniref:aspartyl protease family protein 2-like n=1 Tax=Papaver somniferum TaxID=3469 RepID=UPI000E7022BA|nr:aspartyl protease family protein 2-like [Papaver somniferum]
MASESSNNDGDGDGDDDYDFSFPIAPGPYWKLPSPSLVLEYFTVLRVSTSPAIDYVLVVDTGSSLTWIQCFPCNKCYEQVAPIFDPKRSATYSVRYCNQHVSPCDGCNDRGECTYNYVYGDGSYSQGVIAQEVYSVGDHMMNLTIGCAHNSSGTFNHSDGILGLGRAEFSFASQVDRRYGFKKFSYCLVDKSMKEVPVVSSIRFGNDLLDLPSDVVYTPIIQNPDHYYINLTSIIVASKLITVHTSLPNGIMVDSGALLSSFPRPLYEAVRDPFRVAALRLGWKPVTYKYHDTCYDLSSYTGGIVTVKAPEVILYFAGDDEAAIDLKAENVLFNYAWVEANFYCLAFRPNLYEGFAILGNVQQQGIRVVYDNVEKVIGWFDSLMNGTITDSDVTSRAIMLGVYGLKDVEKCFSSSTTFSGGIGLIIRNVAGTQQAARCIYLTEIRSAEQAECIGLWQAVRWEKEQKLEKVHFEMDAKFVVDAVNKNNGAIDWRLHNIVLDIKHLFSVYFLEIVLCSKIKK